jgi:hypothetical protein
MATYAPPLLNHDSAYTKINNSGYIIMPSLNTSSVDSQADNVGTDFTTATLIIYDGTPPANANTALAGNTALVTHTLTGWAASVAGVIVANAVPDAAIAATGTASFARLVLTTKTMQVTVGTSGQELILSSTSYVSGEDSIVNSLQITQPAT